uniref:tRNA (34-2'-O)-methyltransferase regulator WDR6 n=1 Tax=Trichuris muris TaxID=70415 RepID=A0A5S6QEY6_TRIMR
MLGTTEFRTTCHLPHHFIAKCDFRGNGFFLIAQGRWLLMLNADNFEILASFEIFPCDNVHGVSISGALFCCFGNRSFRLGIVVGRSRRAAVVLRLFPKVNRVSDWILQAKVIPSGAVLLLTMHNSLFEYDIGSANFTERRCDLRSVSYCGKIYGDSSENLCAISGTATGSVLIWLPLEHRVRVAHVLHAHNGAIFDVAFCLQKRLLCSVSDDRSCRLWKMQLHHDSAGNKPPTVMEWSESTFACLFVVYGHSARVWRAEFSIFGLLSTGEDGSVIMWSDQGDILWTKHVVNGSLRALYVNDEASYVLVGADSGSIVRLPLWPVVTTYRWNLSHCMKRPSERVVQVVLLSQNPVSFLCASNFGNVFIHDVTGNRLVVSDHNLRLFVSCRSANDGLLAFGGLNGAFYLLRNGKLNNCSCATATTRKIFSMHMLDPNNRLLICAENGRMLLFDCSPKNSAVLYQPELSLPVGHQRWTGAAILVSLSDRRHKLVVGDRNGSVHFYTLENSANFPEKSYWHVHGRHGVTDFCLANDLLCSIGRNSTLCLWKEEDRTGTFKLLSKERLWKGLDWPSRFVFRKRGLQIAGFHGDRFLIYDFELQGAVFEIPCGGGHRSYDVALSEEDGGCFACIAQGNLLFARWQHDVTLLAQGTHWRRINDVCLLGSSFDKSMLIATCSDDTAIMLWKFDKRLILMQRLVGHVSSVFRLHGEDDFILSAGGRAELLVWRYHAGRFCLADRVHDASDYRYTSLDCQSLSSVDAHYLIVAARSDAAILAYRLEMKQCGAAKLSLAFQFSSVSCVFDATLIRLAGTAMTYVVACSDGTLYARHFVADAPDAAFQPWDFKCTIESCSLTAIAALPREGGCSFEKTTIAVGAESGKVYLLDPRRGDSQAERLEPPFASSVTCTKCTCNGLLVAVSAEDRLHIWQCRPDLPCCYGRLCKTILLNLSDPLSLCVSMLGSKLHIIVCGSGMQYIRLHLSDLLCMNCFEAVCNPKSN